jgi:hypothetical protein
MSKRMSLDGQIWRGILDKWKQEKAEKEQHNPPWTAPKHTHCYDPRHAEPCLQPCAACAEECDPKFLAECPGEDDDHS